MFTWICPQSGREVPPSYDECPDCAARLKAAAQEGGAPLPPPLPQQTQAAPPAPPPRPAAPPRRPPAQRPGLPVWLLTILFALAFVGLGAGVYWTVDWLRNRDRTQAAAPPGIALENPAAKGKAKPHPLQRYIEVAGVRFIQDAKKRTEARFVLVNHSPDQISDLAGTVMIWGRTQKSEEEAVGTFSFKVPTLGPWESRDLSAPVETKLRVYELPDWQNITAEVQITAP